MINLNDKAIQIFEQNKAVGWWDDMDRCIWQTLQLVSTEIAEATEGYRKDLMDDHLPHRKMEEVELADALIRILDLGGRCEWVYAGIEPDDKELLLKNLADNNYSNGACHFGFNVTLVELSHAINRQKTDYELGNKDTSVYYTAFINYLLLYSEWKGFDILGAMEEKITYNANRADHKRENRSKDGGKKI